MTTLIEYVKSSRKPAGALYGPGDIAGEDDRVAVELVRQGVARLFDAGAGLGVPNPLCGAPHEREAYEKSDDATWLKRKPEVEAASKREALALREKFAAELPVREERARNAAREAHLATIR
jgi:hypothetical protein